MDGEINLDEEITHGIKKMREESKVKGKDGGDREWLKSGGLEEEMSIQILSYIATYHKVIIVNQEL